MLWREVKRIESSGIQIGADISGMKPIEKLSDVDGNLIDAQFDFMADDAALFNDLKWKRKQLREVAIDTQEDLLDMIEAEEDKKL